MENFNFKKFLVENKLTANSKMLKEGVELSPEAKEEIEGAIENWVPADVAETSDHMGEMITQALEDIDGQQLPEGMFNNNMHNALLELSKEFHNGQLDLESAVQKAVTIVMNPQNYGTGE